MRKILIATKNQGKFNEIKEYLSDLELELFSLNDLSIDEDVEENGDTYAENALIKAKFYFNKSKMPVLADDSGIEIEALKGEMGVKTRRWGAGEKASDEKWIEFFLDRMKEFQEKERRARFLCAMIYFDGKNEDIFLGESLGVITSKLEAPIIKGIPLSSCFLPDNCNRVFSDLSKEEKSMISHRGRALKLFRDYYLRLY